jgi:hypothetical protein
MTSEMRNNAVAAYDALSHWRDEIETANQRCLGEVTDKMCAVARAMGWPDHAIRATREYLETASKAQTAILDQLVTSWKEQLKSPTAPLGVPGTFARQLSETSNSPPFKGMPEFNPMAPWTFWMQMAEAWQRTWVPEATRRHDRSN